MKCAPHKGDVTEKVIEGAYEVLGIFDNVADDMEMMKSISLTQGEQNLFACAALTYRYEDDEKFPITESQLLTPRRWEDKKDDLWTTFQRVQENMIQGGLSGRNSQGKRTRTRAVNGIDGDLKLNRALWLIAENFKNHKA